MSLEIVTHTNTVLTTKTRKLTQEEILSDETQKLIQEMVDLASDMGALGLAAPQVGKNLALAIYRPKPSGGFAVLINPILEGFGSKVYSYNEGCLSSPAKRFDIKRFKKVRVKAQNRYGEEFELKSRTKMEAFVLQHEIDHLNGITLEEHGKER